MKDITIATIEAPFVQTEDDQEYKLIRTAAEAVHKGNWIVGKCASQWYHTYRKQRTDGDFGDMVGLSEDQVFQRRRVWEEFWHLHEQLPDLKWSHFREALTWEGPEEYLQWASENEATVKEMTAYKKARCGEPLFPVAEKPLKAPEGRTEFVDRTPAKPAAREVAQPATTTPTRPSVAPAPARTVDPTGTLQTVEDAIEKASGLVQFVVKHGTEQDRLRMVGVIKPLLDGIRGSGR